MAMQTGAQEDIVTGINVTPLVDVGLVLVIIFMVAAPIFQQPALEVKLPKTHTEEGKERENITITITSDGRMAVNEQQVTLEELDLILRMRLNRSYEKHVIIRADQDSIHGNLLLTMRKAKEFGAKSIAIATEPKNANVVQEDLE